MYCSEKCRESDWNNGHRDSCYYLFFCYESVLGREESRVPFSTSSSFLTCVSQCLYTYFGVENLKRAAQHNESMAVHSDPRTKGFSHGKFNTATLEAFLSLEDNLDKLSQQEIDDHAWVIL